MATTTEYIQVTHRELPYSTFDADNHLYENGDALTSSCRREYEGVIKYVEVNGRTKLAIRDRISDYIPNPTFGKVAVPGRRRATTSPRGQGFRRGASLPPAGKMLVMPGIDAFFDPEPRLELMKEMGIDRTLLWPTLASAIEERMADDPDVAAPSSTRSTRGCTSTGATCTPTPSTPRRSSAWPRAGPGAGGARVHPRAGSEDLPHPGCARADLAGAQVLRPARVRSVLGAGAGARPRRRHALR